MPRICVALPVHNAAQFLEDALDSLLRQTFRDFNIIAVNDGSTDQSASILERYAERDQRIRVVHQDHQGVTPTLNHCLALADSEFVARFDSDDIALPNRFEQQVAFLIDSPKVAAVGGKVQTIDREGRLLRAVSFPTTWPQIKQRLRHGVPLAHPAAMLRLGPVLRIGGYRAAFTYAEDYDLWLQLAERHTLSNLPEVVIQYRIHRASLSSLRWREQAVRAFGARLAADRRQAGRADPFQGVREPITRAMVEELAGESRALLSVWELRGFLNVAGVPKKEHFHLLRGAYSALRLRTLSRIDRGDALLSLIRATLQGRGAVRRQGALLVAAAAFGSPITVGRTLGSRALRGVGSSLP